MSASTPPPGDPDGIRERILEILRVRGWTAGRFSKKAGLKSPSHVRNLIDRGARRPSPATIAALAMAASVREEWLWYGRGERDELSASVALATEHDAVGAPKGGLTGAAVDVVEVVGASWGHAEHSEHSDATAPSSVPAETDPRMRNREHFESSLRGAKQLRPELPAYIWPVVADADPLLSAPLSPLMLAELADFLLRHVPPPLESPAPSRRKP